MRGRTLRGLLAMLAAVVAAALLLLGTAAQPSLASAGHHLSGGGTASISQVAMNVHFSASGSVSGTFECLMAGRSAFVLPGFGLAHSMIVHASPTAGWVSGTQVNFSGPGRLSLDGHVHQDIHIDVQVDVATQTFQLTVLEVGAMPVETMLSGHLSLS
jgi:hypothetical protein